MLPSLASSRLQLLLLSWHWHFSLELWGLHHFHKPDLYGGGEVLLQESVTYPAVSPGTYIRDVRLVINMLREGRSCVFSNCRNCRVTATHPAVFKWMSRSICCQPVQEGEELIRLYCQNTQLGETTTKTSRA